MIPRDEINRVDAMLVSIAMHENLGYLTKSETKQFTHNQINSGQLLFQYGDLLTDDMFHNLPKILITQLTEIGSAPYVHPITKAMCHYTLQHGYLYKNFHRLKVI